MPYFGNTTCSDDFIVDYYNLQNLVVKITKFLDIINRNHKESINATHNTNSIYSSCRQAHNSCNFTDFATTLKAKAERRGLI